MRSATPILATHFFCRTWAPDFWSHVLPAEIAPELDFIQQAGFNTVILVVPWAGFQPAIHPIQFNLEYLQLLQEITHSVQQRGMHYLLRLGYLHEYGVEAQPSGLVRQGIVLADATMHTAWLAYLHEMHRVAGKNPACLGAFISWEDFYLLKACPPKPATRLSLAGPLGYQAYLQQKYSLAAVAKAYGQPFQQFEQVPVPHCQDAAISLFIEFWQYFLLELVRRSRTAFPSLALEARVDCETVRALSAQDSAYACHTATFNAPNPAHPTAQIQRERTVVYYAPAWGAKNQHNDIDAATALAGLHRLLTHISRHTRNELLVDQFNFTDNTPSHEHNTTIQPHEIAKFLEQSAPLLYSHTQGYGLWTIRDLPRNILKNGRFARSTRGWDLRHARRVWIEGQPAVQLADGGRITQAVLDCTQGKELLCENAPMPEDWPFTLRLRYQLASPGAATLTLGIWRHAEGGAGGFNYQWTIVVPPETTTWRELTLRDIPFTWNDAVWIENHGQPVLLADVYFYQSLQENGIFTWDNQPKPYAPALVRLNRTLQGMTAPKFIDKAAIQAGQLLGVDQDLWMSDFASGRLAMPQTDNQQPFVLRAYVPPDWRDYTNQLQVWLGDSTYPLEPPVVPGYNEWQLVIAPEAMNHSIVPVRVQARQTHPLSRFIANADRREISVQLLGLGFGLP